MQFDQVNFLTLLKGLVTGGGRHTDGSGFADSGYLRDIVIPLSAVDLETTVIYDGSESSTALATFGGAWITADETNARVVKVEESIDTIGHLSFPIPRDYDEATDILKVRVLASMIAVSTDTDVELDMKAYVKTAGSALGSDLNPTAPGTVLSTTEQWLEFDLGGNSLTRDDVPTITLITNGANDTDGEEILIHAVQLTYASTLVSYDEKTAANVELR